MGRITTKPDQASGRGRLRPSQESRCRRQIQRRELEEDPDCRAVRSGRSGRIRKLWKIQRRENGQRQRASQIGKSVEKRGSKGVVRL